MSEALVREYLPADEPQWLRCRVLSFLHTSYFDDVLTTKPKYEGPSIEFVATDGHDLVGILDIAGHGDFFTIETVAVDPDAARSGVASALLGEAITRLPKDATLLDAWTRDDAPANAWYQKLGFTEAFRYLHVYAKEDSEIASAIEATRPGLTPVSSFFHATIAQEDEMRANFNRVYVCRRYVRRLDGS